MPLKSPINESSLSFREMIQQKKKRLFLTSFPKAIDLTHRVNLLGVTY
jgi:hypothetical protein